MIGNAKHASLRTMKLRLLITLGLILLFTNTAIIHGSGGPGEALVLKPLHGLYPFYGGGEEGSWARQHPDRPLPWWHHPRNDYVVLHQSSHETTIAPWTVIYGLAYVLCVGLVGLSLGQLIIHATRLRKRKRSTATPPP